MSVYPQLSNPDFYKISEEILAWWKENEIFEESISSREGQETFTFYEGPPSANGTPGIHHVMARTIKDIFCRYQTLKGKQVKRKGGWDTHGLPIELQVEKELGITKDDIGKKISVEEYNKKCREAVMKFTDQWNQLTEMMGYWVDLEDPYITYKNDYIESLWFLLKKLYDKGLLYKGYTIQPYSPAAGTGLSSHELNQPGTYKEVKDTSIVAQFKVFKNEKSDFLFQKTENETFILAWTTTPWTLPSNSALTVGKNIDYQLIETFNPYTYLPISVVCARDRVSSYFPEIGKDADFSGYKPGDKMIPWKVVLECKGSDLEGVEYEQLMPYVKPNEPAFRVISGDFVTTEDGTGVVHTAPTFGADDFRVAQQNGIPPIMVTGEDGKQIPLVNKQGRFVEEVKDYALEPVKEQYLTDTEKESERIKQGREKYLSVDERIGIQLKTENRAFNVQKFDHPYPHCWRTDKPVLYYPLDSWFIKTTAVKDKMIALNKQINWKPESTGTGRFGNWLENLVDWNLSRSRYWGTPLPIWRTEDGKEEICIGSVAQLKTEIQKSIKAGFQTEDLTESENFDLHRPFVDNIILVSPTGKLMNREADLIDVWFDSGAMPYAQWHYPFENQEVFHKNFPADFISEGVDQTRGWFFTLHAISAMLSDDVEINNALSPAFLNVVSTGLVLDKNGEKMSKRTGNVINPFEAIKKYGPDPVRWYMITNSNPWDNLKFNLDGITEVRNKFFGTLSNTYNFFALYANIDGYKVQENNRLPYSSLTEIDRWVLSKLNSLVEEVDGYYADYEPTKAGRAIQDFVCDHLSNWYVRLGRKRFWRGEMTENKQAAYETLQHCLLTVSKLMSPIAPFFGEWLYKAMMDGSDEVSSVHLAFYPKVDKSAINSELEAAMELAQRTSSLVHSLRKNHKLKVRQPLGRMLVPVVSKEFRANLEKVEDLILSEVNIKKLEYIEDTAGLVEKSAKPNFKKLGKSLGPKLKAFGELVAGLSQVQINQYEKTGSLDVDLDGQKMTLVVEDLEIRSESIPGWVVANDQEITVALDLAISEELRMEGIARDVVNRVQNQRKDMGLEVMDRIQIRFEKVSNDLITKALEANREYICTETQANSLEIVELSGLDQVLELDELSVNFDIVKS
jgi:isoleucyl-tRNA synthetase